ncbi:hypothetical protein ASD58_29105 [Duganella sp. Root1480D1]|nr:hypothetical protein ASD58_29105 [Duganella sp. Root1480D1]
MLGCGGVSVRSLSAAPNNLPTDAVVLRVEVLENVFTDFRPKPDCPEGQQCIEFYGWAKYRARVREVISGDWDPVEVTFARLEHGSYVDKVTRDCYVILHPASPDFQSKLGVPFIAEKLLSNFFESDRAAIKDLLKGR